MAGIPHPFTMTVLAAQRRASWHAEVERERRGQLAQQRTARPRPWAEFAAMVAIVVSVALVLAAGSALAQGVLPLARPGLPPAAGHAVPQAPEQHVLDPGAARRGQATRL